MTRFLFGIAAAGLFLAVGLGTYHLLESQRSGVVARPESAGQPKVNVPGTIYVAQQGALYRLSGTRRVQLKPGSGEWAQPAAAPDGRLVAVSRLGNQSELFLLDGDGRQLRQLTSNTARAVEQNHWAFYPAVSPDGATLYFSYDPKDAQNNFRVDLAVYSLPLGGGGALRRRTLPVPYSGGDVQAVPLRSGALVFTRYGVDEHGDSRSQLWLVPAAGGPGRALTEQADNCGSPRISPDETRLALTCSYGRQSARLEVAGLEAGVLGPRRVLVADQLLASPAWSPDGAPLLYLAPASPGAGFQLWSLAVEAGAGAPPRMLTENLELDATSAPLWVR